MSSGYSRGQSFGALDLPESARSNLHSALESEVGTVLGGRRGRALPQAIEKQLGELVTSNSKPRGAYKVLIEKTGALKSELEGLRTRRHELAKTLEDLEETQGTLARLSVGDRDQADQTELTEARKRHAQLAELEARIAAAASDLELKKRNLEQANNAQTERAGLKETIAAEEKAVEQAGQRLENVRQHEKAARSQLDALRAGVREAEAAVTQLTGSFHGSAAHWPPWNAKRGFTSWRAAAVKRRAAEKTSPRGPAGRRRHPGYRRGH